MWGAGLSVMTEAGVRGVAAASDPASERIDELQFALGEGPCMDAFTSRRPVLEADLARREGALAGVLGRGARPRRARGVRVPVADRRRPARRAGPVPRRAGPLSAEELAQALTFADVATTCCSTGRSRRRPGGRRRAGRGLAYRSELHQAQGMVMVQLGVSLAEALALLRAYAYVARPRPRRRGPRRGEPGLRLDAGPSRRCLTAAVRPAATGR